MEENNIAEKESNNDEKSETTDSVKSIFEILNLKE